MKKILIVLLLVITAGGTGWYFYQCGYRLPNRPHWHNGLIAPVTIADTATSYSVVQKYHMERPDFPFPRTDAELAEFAAHYDDKTFVPPSVRYVRVEYLASVVEKPYHKIFFAEKTFPTDTLMLENVDVVKSATMAKILSSAENLSCEPNSAVLDERSNLVEVLMRGKNNKLKRCLLSYKSGCNYLNRLRQLSRELDAVEGYGLSSLLERMKCSAYLWPWERYIASPNLPFHGPAVKPA